MAASTQTTETIHENGRSELRTLGDEHVDDYSLRIGPMYAEFSDVQWQDHVLLIQSTDGGGYVSVSHDSSHTDISKAMYRKLLEIRDR